MGCGESVQTSESDRDGNIEVRCLYCGLVLDVKKPEASGKPEPVEKISSDSAGDEPVELIVIADDSDFLREFLKSMILKKGLAKEVVDCVNGQEFVAKITRLLASNKKIGLVILDLEMPVMDGITAARTMRAVEEKLETGPKVPILFFSVHRCDEDMKKKLSIAHPASYINKGSDAEPDKLAQRVDQLVKHLVSKIGA